MKHGYYQFFSEFLQFLTLLIMKTYLTIILSRFTQYICKSILRIMSFFLISLANKAIWKASIFQGYPAASACHRGQDRPGPPHRASDCYRSNRPSRAFLMRFHSTAAYLSNYPCVAGFSLSASRMASAPWPEIFKRKKKHGFMSAIRSAGERGRNRAVGSNESRLKGV